MEMIKPELPPWANRGESKELARIYKKEVETLKRVSSAKAIETAKKEHLNSGESMVVEKYGGEPGFSLKRTEEGYTVSIDSVRFTISYITVKHLGFEAVEKLLDNYVADRDKREKVTALNDFARLRTSLSERAQEGLQDSVLELELATHEYSDTRELKEAFDEEFDRVCEKAAEAMNHDTTTKKEGAQEDALVEEER